MRILFATSEAAPFIKTGGLGDVCGALPKALAAEGVDVRVILPLYTCMDQTQKDQMAYLGSFYTNISWRSTYCGVFTSKVGNVVYYFLDNEQYFSRPNVYGEYDDSERFAFFSKAVLDTLNFVDFFPDIIHTNDWQTALLPVYLNAFYRSDPRYGAIKTVLSIHNIEFQGKYNPIILGSIFGLDVMHRSLLMYDGDLNLLKGGIESSDRVITVSKTYAEEILSPAHSFGLHNILLPRRHKLKGVVNGIDTEVFNPETDPYIFKNYTYETIRFKSLNKRQLQKDMGLALSNDIPIIGMVTRLTHQKGIDLICQVADQLSALPIQFIVLGTGDSGYERFFYCLEQAHRDKVRSYIGFSKEVAQKIYSGADMFLMPSESEPCGLAQMIAMRYGTIPIVHAVGGLADTVTPFHPEEKTGNGITFQSLHPYDMLDAIHRSIELFYNKPLWRALRKNAMQSDYSWKKPAQEYLAIYQEILNERGM